MLKLRNLQRSLVNGHHLHQLDIDRANQLLAEGYTREQVLRYVRSWCDDYAYVEHAESMAANDFDDCAYCRD